MEEASLQERRPLLTVIHEEATRTPLARSLKRGPLCGHGLDEETTYPPSDAKAYDHSLTQILFAVHTR